jgi:hypothetical protein
VAASHLPEGVKPLMLSYGKFGGYPMMNDLVDQDASNAWAEAHLDGES